MKVEQDERCGELLHGDATQKDVDSETATYNSPDELRQNLLEEAFRLLLQMDEEQIFYVLQQLGK